MPLSGILDSLSRKQAGETCSSNTSFATDGHPFLQPFSNLLLPAVAARMLLLAVFLPQCQLLVNFQEVSGDAALTNHHDASYSKEHLFRKCNSDKLNEQPKQCPPASVLTWPYCNQRPPASVFAL
jgi:hypothetical protein